MASSLSADARIGTELAGYRIEGLLGRGGMSVVYLAEDLALGRKVALKLIAPEFAEDLRFRERFRRESRLAASLDHPNVIPIYEAGEAEGILYIAMRYVEGTDLKSLLARERALAPRRALALLSQVAAGLDGAHARGLVHRDVKPSNVLLAGEPEREHVYLADFGLTKSAFVPDRAAESVQLSGTADYVAPEQITEGIAGTAADIYALGCVLYETLAGQVPYPRSSEFETLWAHVEEPPPKPSEQRAELPAELDRVVEQAMAKSPSDRYASGAELVDAARAVLPTARRFGRGTVAVAATALAAVVAGAVLATVLLTGRGDERSATAPTLELAGGALQRVDPKSMHLVATMKVKSEPIDVAAGPGGVWLAGGAGPSFHRIVPETNDVSRGPAIPGIEAAIAASRTSVWLATYGSEGQGLLVDLDPKTASVRAKIGLRALASKHVGPAPPPVSAISAVVADPELEPLRFEGWIVDAAEGSLRRIQTGPAGRRSLPIETGGTPLALDVRGDALWVAQKGEVLELRIDRSGGARVASRTAVPGTPIAVAAGQQGVWVASRERRLFRILSGGRVARSVEVNAGLPPWKAQGRPVDLALGGGSLWLLLDDGTLDRLDPRTGESLGTVDVGTNPVALAAGGGAVWVAVRGGDRLRTFPRRYYEPVGPAGPIPWDCSPGRTTCLARLRGELEAGDGTPALFEAGVREHRRAGGSVRCADKTYRGPATADVRKPGTGLIRIDRWGSVALRFERLVSVAPTVEVPASKRLCGLITGRWLGIAGALKGAEGRFTWVAPQGSSKGYIVLR